MDAVTRIRIGVDAGATLVKLAIERAPGEIEHRLLPSEAPEAVVAAIGALSPERVGLTGGGAAQLEALLDPETVRVNEFAAWGNGASDLLASQGAAAGEPYLLVSLGTGTSVMLSDGMAVNRVGGTAIGGGTVVGLGALLLGSRDFGVIAELARRGDRRSIDLLVSDIYRPGEIALTGDLTAANFGKLSRDQAGQPAAEDLAHAIMGLVGENVALICGGLGGSHQVRRLVFGGSTLRDNPALVEIVGAISRATGSQVQFLADGEYAGALGALLLAES